MKTGKIYIITNLVNGKYYVGKTTQSNPRCRFNQHKTPNRATLLSMAIQKYGENQFSFEVVAETSDLSGLDDLEKLWISVLSANRRGMGYNLTDGGANYTRTKEMRSSHAAKLKGRTGYKHTPEAIQKMREICKGRKPSAEAVRKSVELRTGKPSWNSGKKGVQIAWNKGIPMTEEMKRHQSALRKGKPMSEENRAKISAAMKGRMPTVNLRRMEVAHQTL